MMNSTAQGQYRHQTHCGWSYWKDVKECRSFRPDQEYQFLGVSNMSAPPGLEYTTDTDWKPSELCEFSDGKTYRFRPPGLSE
jgi:hypothetical protein